MQQMLDLLDLLRPDLFLLYSPTTESAPWLPLMLGLLRVPWFSLVEPGSVVALPEEDPSMRWALKVLCFSREDELHLCLGGSNAERLPLPPALRLDSGRQRARGTIASFLSAPSWKQELEQCLRVLEKVRLDMPQVQLLLWTGSLEPWAWREICACMRARALAANVRLYGGGREPDRLLELAEILLSTSSTRPWVLGLASSMGLPCVAYDVPPYEDRSCGVDFVAPGDVEDAAARIIHIFENGSDLAATRPATSANPHSGDLFSQRLREALADWGAPCHAFDRRDYGNIMRMVAVPS